MADDPDDHYPDGATAPSEPPRGSPPPSFDEEWESDWSTWVLRVEDRAGVTTRSLEAPIGVFIAATGDPRGATLVVVGRDGSELLRTHFDEDGPAGPW